MGAVFILRSKFDHLLINLKVNFEDDSTLTARVYSNVILHR